MSFGGQDYMSEADALNDWDFEDYEKIMKDEYDARPTLTLPPAKLPPFVLAYDNYGSAVYLMSRKYKGSYWTHDISKARKFNKYTSGLDQKIYWGRIVPEEIELQICSYIRDDQ